MAVTMEVHIEELILHGLPRGASHVIAAAIEAELGRMLATRGLSRSFVEDVSIGTLDAGSFQASASEREGRLGERIGRAVYTSLESRE